jgi:hypothetical protein
MAAARNVVILKWQLCEKKAGNSPRWWEIGLAQTQDGGCVKKQMAGRPFKIVTARNVIILKNGGK